MKYIIPVSILLLGAFPLLGRAQESKTFQQIRQEMLAAKDAYLRTRADFVLATRRTRPVATTTSEQGPSSDTAATHEFVRASVRFMLRHTEAGRHMLESLEGSEETYDELEESVSFQERGLKAVQNRLEEPLGRAELRRESRALKDLWKSGRIALKRISLAVRAERVRKVSGELTRFSREESASDETLNTLTAGIDEDIRLAMEKFFQTGEEGGDVTKLLIDGHADIRRAMLRLKELQRLVNARTDPSDAPP